MQIKMHLSGGFDEMLSVLLTSKMFQVWRVRTLAHSVNTSGSSINVRASKLESKSVRACVCMCERKRDVAGKYLQPEGQMETNG